MKKLITLLLVALIMSCSHKTGTEPNNLGLNGFIKLVTEYEYNDIDSLVTKRIIKFDKKGRLLNDTKWTKNGIQLTKVVNHYNFWGKLDKAEFFDGQDSLLITEDYYYSNNRVDSILIYDYNGKQITTSTFSYNDHGNIKESIVYDSIRIITMEDKYIYDEFQHLNELEIISYDSNFISCRYKYNRDSKGNVIEYWYYNAKGKLLENTRNQYEYDQLDNWIKKTISEKGGIIYTIKREIDYK